MRFDPRLKPGVNEKLRYKRFARPKSEGSADLSRAVFCGGVVDTTGVAP